MASTPATRLSDVPAWPAEPGAPVVVLSDAASDLELKLVRDWVAATAPSGDPVDVVRIPPSRRRKRNHRLDPRLAARLASADDPLLVPVRVVWMADRSGGRRGLGAQHFITLRDPRDPDVISQHITLRLRPDRVRLLVGVPARASRLRADWGESVEDMSLEDFVARRAWLALERAERELRGTRYKIPKFVHDEILNRREFRDGLTRLAPQVGRPLEQMNRKAKEYLREIAAKPSPFVIDLVASGIRVLYRQGYQRIDYDTAQFRDLYKLGAEYPLVFLPSHKSNLDHLVLQYLLWENDLPPNHTAAGINMNFFPVGPLIRRAGAFFIRRSFKDNETYKFVLKTYLEYLIEKRFPLEWYIEGGRSRSGKLLAPRYGMLVYVADALSHGKSDDIYLIPTSIAYDHIQEIKTYTAEQQGAPKEKESMSWMVRAIRSLRKRYGNIHLRFGEPLSLAKELDPDLTGDARYLDIQKVAFEVCVRINRVTPITPTSVATVALLADPDRAQSSTELRTRLTELGDEIDRRQLPRTAPLDHLRTDHGIYEVMSGLAEHGIVEIIEGGPETVYRVREDNHIGAAYYRNTIIHFFVNEAIGEVALAAAERADGDHLAAFWAEVGELRDLLKFEFFFPEREEFREEIRQALCATDPRWESLVAAGSEGIDRLIREIVPLHGPWVLRSFVEAYGILARTLSSDEIDGTLDEKAIIDAALARGKQYVAQRRISAPEAVSQSLFKTALQLAGNRGLLDESDPDVGRRREEFAAELRDVLARLDTLSAIDMARHRRH